MLTIADVMARDAPTCSPDTSITEGVRILRDAAASAVFAVTDGRVVGLLTDRAVALAVAEHGESHGRLTVKDLMNVDVPTVAADSRLDVLLDKFTDAGVAVIDSDRRIQGVVRWADLLGHLSERALGRLVTNLFQRGHSESSEAAR